MGHVRCTWTCTLQLRHVALALLTLACLMTAGRLLRKEAQPVVLCMLMLQKTLQLLALRCGLLLPDTRQSYC
jgi:hypothetical protein